MKRRNFLWMVSIGSAGILIPMYGCEDELTEIEVLAIPVSMLKVSSTKTINELGELYKESQPEESDYEVLIELLSEEPTDLELKKFGNLEGIQKMLKNKISTDFEHDNIVVLDGWILSRTEARQCALFSLIS